MHLYNWTEEDLEDLDAKFDALIEHLGIEFVFERVSDGSDAADRSRCYARVKAQDPVSETPAPTKKEAIAASVIEPQPEPEPEQSQEVSSVKPDCDRCHELGRKCIRHRPKKGY